MIPSLKFSDDDWNRITKTWTAWWAGGLDRPIVMIENPVRQRSQEELTEEFLLHRSVDQVLDYYHARFENLVLYGDAWPKWWPFFGAGVMAAFLGAELICTPDEDTIWFEPSHLLESFDLNPFYDPHNIWWQRILELTQAAADRWGNKICVGFTDLGGNLDILASLRESQKLLMDLYDQPDAVEAASQQITQYWLKYYIELETITKATGRGTSPWAPIWSDKNCYILQSDFAAMISPKMFERFVLPDIVSCCNYLDHAFYHLDGKGQIPHLDLLLSIENLYGIQWIPGDGQSPPEDWLPVLKQIRDAGKLCQIFVSAAGARKIINNLGGKGFAFYIHDNLNHEEATALLDEFGWTP